MPPGWDGIKTITKIWEKYPDLQVIVCTAYSDYSWEQMVSELGHLDRIALALTLALLPRCPFMNFVPSDLNYVPRIRLTAQARRRADAFAIQTLAPPE
jgi:DNA-binding LytR/AlgR family response regulator